MTDITLTAAEPMRKDDELEPGVDKPTRVQYVIGTVMIVIVSLGAYWWLSRH